MTLSNTISIAAVVLTAVTYAWMWNDPKSIPEEHAEVRVGSEVEALRIISDSPDMRIQSTATLGTFPPQGEIRAVSSKGVTIFRWYHGVRDRERSGSSPLGEDVPPEVEFKTPPHQSREDSTEAAPHF